MIQVLLYMYKSDVRVSEAYAASSLFRSPASSAPRPLQLPPDAKAAVVPRPKLLFPLPRDAQVKS